MALNDRKITESGVRLHGVQSAPDRLIGNAQENKKVFDNYILSVLQGLMNGLINDLLSTTAGNSGAGQIGLESIEGVAGNDVLTALVSIKTQLDAKATAASTEAALETKAEKSVVMGHIKSVEFDADTGTFLFTKEDGSFTSIDTALEKISTNFTWDAEKQALILTLPEGNTREISLSAFVSETEFESSDQILFSVANHKVKATVKAGSITEAMLSTALLEKLLQQVSSAGSSATDAAGSAAQAKLSEEAAAQRAADAEENAGAAAQSATDAKQSAAAAAQSVIDAQTAQKAVEDLEVFAESVGAENQASVKKSTVNGKMQMVFYLPKGDRGDPFVYENFTEEQLKEITGPAGKDGIMSASVEEGVLKFVAGGGDGGPMVPATETTIGGVIVGDNLSVTPEGRISVETADEAAQDNTKPITSAAVHTLAGNIEAILATI